MHKRQGDNDKGGGRERNGIHAERYHVTPKKVAVWLGQKRGESRIRDSKWSKGKLGETLVVETHRQDRFQFSTGSKHRKDRTSYKVVREKVGNGIRVHSDAPGAYYEWGKMCPKRKTGGTVPNATGVGKR